MVTVIGPTPPGTGDMTGQRETSQNRHPTQFAILIAIHSSTSALARHFFHEVCCLQNFARPLIAATKDICSSSNFRRRWWVGNGSKVACILARGATALWFSNDIGTTNHDCSLPFWVIPCRHLHDPEQALKAPWGGFQPMASIFNGWKPSIFLSDQSLKDYPHRYVGSGSFAPKSHAKGDAWFVVFDHFLLIQLGWCFQEVVSLHFTKACRNSRTLFISYIDFAGWIMPATRWQLEARYNSCALLIHCCFSAITCNFVASAFSINEYEIISILFLVK